LVDDSAGHAAEEGRQAGGHDDRGGRPALDARAQVADVGQFQRGSARRLFPGGEPPTLVNSDSAAAVSVMIFRA
jgi:hypothetical protein